MSGGRQQYKARGLIPRALAQLFQEIRSMPDQEVKVSIQYLEVGAVLARCGWVLQSAVRVLGMRAAAAGLALPAAIHATHVRPAHALSDLQ